MKKNPTAWRSGWAFGAAAVLAACAAGCRGSRGGAGDPVAEMNRGVAYLEQYQYLEALKVFEELAARFPKWEAAHVNRGIAAWNLQDKYFKVAEEAFQRALELNPRSPHALLSLAVLYNYTERWDQALDLAQRVVQIDPYDPHSQYQLGVFLADKGRMEEARAALERAVKLQPSFASALYRLMSIYQRSSEPAKREEAQDIFNRLKATDSGVVVGNRYGENGKYNCAIRGTTPPGWKGSSAPEPERKAPAFGRAQAVGEGAAARRVRPDGRPLAPAFAAGDLDGDGRSEIVLSGQIRVPGAAPETAVYRQSAPERAYELWCSLPDAIACAIGDLDSVGGESLVLAGEGWIRVFAADGEGRLAERTFAAEKTDHAGFPLRLYLADVDSDWDLDVVCLRETAEGGQVRSRLDLLNNNRNGTFRNVSPECGFESFGFPASEIVVADFDGDVDGDIVLIDGSSGKPYVFENMRLWRYRLKEDSPGGPRAPGAAQAAVGDYDGDGDFDLVVFSPDAVRFWKNSGNLEFQEDRALAERVGGRGGAAGVVGDLLGTLRLGVLLLEPGAGEGPAKTDPALGSAGFFAPGDGGGWSAVPVEGLPPAGADASALLALLDLEGPPQLVIYDTFRGATIRQLAPRNTWIGLAFEGSRKPIPDKERANLSALGATVEVRAGARSLVLPVDGGAGGTARCSARAFAGLAGAPHADYVRILWPDSVLQSELSLEAGKVHRIQEIQRKPTSCPVLFAWDGGEFRFIGDFLGVGGLGYFEVPGVYSKPDPSEYVLLEKLEPRGGEYALEVLEPMEECAYLDELRLVAADHPAGVVVVPEEMFAVRGPAPGFRLLAFREILAPAAARDERGRDATEDLRAIDRRYGNAPERDPRFPGLARSEHAIELEFPERLDLWVGPGSSVHLALFGFVEYGYSTSNFAAWQAGESFRAPSVDVERDGRWVRLREEWGFPAGYPRYMTVDLSGLLRPGDRKLRVATNMVIRWDRAFLGLGGAEPGVSVVELTADRAELEFRGFPAEEPMEGSIHPAYAYRDFDVLAPIKVFPGSYTRYGDVRELLREADDRCVLMGPGDGLLLRVRADRLPPVRDGFRRTFLLKAFGYCKDADLYTARPDRVEPLPFRGMVQYPYDGGWPYSPLRWDPAAPGGTGYPETQAHRAYLAEWNTRRVEGGPLEPVWRDRVRAEARPEEGGIR